MSSIRSLKHILFDEPEVYQIFKEIDKKAKKFYESNKATLGYMLNRYKHRVMAYSNFPKNRPLPADLHNKELLYYYFKHRIIPNPYFALLVLFNADLHLFYYFVFVWTNLYRWQKRKLFRELITVTLNILREKVGLPPIGQKEEK